MAMLGVIHRAVLGLCPESLGPEQIRKFFVIDAVANHLDGRSALRRHDKQLATYRNGKFLETTAKSIFGLIDVYNLLPQWIVDASDVHTFQAKLQDMLKELLRCKRADWDIHFPPRHALHSHPLVKQMQTVVTVHGNTECDVTATCDEPLRRTEADIVHVDVPPAWW